MTAVVVNTCVYEQLLRRSEGSARVTGCVRISKEVCMEGSVSNT